MRPSTDLAFKAKIGSLGAFRTKGQSREPSHMFKLGTSAFLSLIVIACGSNNGASGGNQSNGSGGTGSASTTVPATVMATPPSGAYVMPISVQLTSAVGSGEVRYTVDGSVPTAAAPLFDSAITIDQTTEVRAATFVNGTVIGEPTTLVYVSRSTEATSELPLMVLDDYGAGDPTKEVTLKTAFLLIEPVAGQSSLSQPAVVATRAGVHLRGQTSAEFPQRGYKVELWDAVNQDTDISLAGLPAESDWVLHNPYVDKSLIRNAFTYGLGPDMGLMAPKFAFAEVYMNTDSRPLSADDYQGVYLLVESVKNAKNRLDLKQLSEADTTIPTITGGYIFKFELDVAAPPTLSCSATRGLTCWKDLEVSDPAPLNSEQQTWLTAHVQQFHNNLFSAAYADPTSGYAQYIDVDSYVNYLILQELTRNLDAYIRSMYHYKDRDGKIFIGPLWDYNLMGGIGCCGNDPIEGWQYEVPRNGEANGWLQRLNTDPAFRAKVSARYRTLRAGVLSDAAIDERIANLTAPLTNAASRHFDRWPILTQETITYFTTKTDPTWQGQVASFSDWLHQRAAWLDTQW